jgi:hypothetical protein
MKRRSYKELEAELARVQGDNHRLFDAVQAFGNDEVQWYARRTYDGTQFRFGVFGLTRADGGHIIVSSRTGKEDRWLNAVKLIDDAEYEMRHAIGSEYFGALGEYYYQAVRLRNAALEAEQAADDTDDTNAGFHPNPPRKLWIGTEPEPNDRLIVEVTEEDYQRIAAAKGTDQVVSFNDALTTTFYQVRYVDCGASCRCALELVEE